MEKIENNNASASVIDDAYVLTPRNRLTKRYALLLVALAFVGLIAGGWAVNHFYIGPRDDDAIVSNALQQLESSTVGKRIVEALTKRNASDRIALTFHLLSPGPGDSEIGDKIDSYLAALRIAVRAGIPEAKLRYGIALRDGLTGKRDSASALKIFDEVANEMDSGARAGDPVAMYVTAWMLKEGLGKQPDQQKAIEMAKRAVLNLNGWRLESAGYDLADGLQDDAFLAFFDSAIVFYSGIFKGHPDPVLTAKVASRLIDQKVESGPNIGSFSCVDADLSKRIVCMKGWYERGVNAGMERYTLDYAHSMLKNGEALEKIEQMFARGEKYSNPYNRYLHAVVKSMLASDDLQLMNALSDMWTQVTLHTDLPEEYSLKVASFGLEVFHSAVVNSGWEFTALGKPVPLSRKDRFLIAANVRGILMGRVQWMHQQLASLFEDQTDIVKRSQSQEILRKSQIAAQAIRDGLPANAVTLGNYVPADVVTHSNYFDQFDKPSVGQTAKNPEPVDWSQFTPVDPKKGKAVAPPAKDPEQQDRTGYLKGQPLAAVGGMSTFTVDNRQGGKDAVARIYLNGNKPAVRSMYVKQGETFKAESVLPGTYVFRYRFIGSADTYEADKNFPLTQTEVENGTKYSNATVTLFKVKDGNMTTRKVDPNDF